MNTPKFPKSLNLVTLCTLWVSLIAVHGIAQAQAPGQDTVKLTTAPNPGWGGGGQERPGKGLENGQGMNAGIKAKIARYTAQSMSKGEENQVSQSIVETADSAGFNKTCVQEIGSSAAPTGISSGRYGPRAQDQVVVLRGDFVNVCR